MAANRPADRRKRISRGVVCGSSVKFGHRRITAIHENIPEEERCQGQFDERGDSPLGRATAKYLVLASARDWNRLALNTFQELSPTPFRRTITNYKCHRRTFARLRAGLFLLELSLRGMRDLALAYFVRFDPGNVCILNKAQVNSTDRPCNLPIGHVVRPCN